MLKKQHRLTTAGFNEVFKVGRRLHTPYFQLIYIPSGDFHTAVVVGKKVSKTAVGRNRLRRQVYGAVYSFTQITPLAFTILMVAKPALKNIPSRAVKPAVFEALTTLLAR
ncbi:MAG: hypothetical protein AUK16_01060 [Parcubacteria group bacterium CG2_30_44_11]|nr:MAG: hypothetical protein AUK16_01060 [Parcubacteria group bacterium CG2_30_44_11]